MPSRRKTREFVLQVLFAADGQDKDPGEVLPILEKHFEEDEDEEIKLYRIMEDFARALVASVSNHDEAIDAIIMRLSRNWKLSRMNSVDRNILRMAIAEMTGFPDIPTLVTLNEAVDLAKKYGTEHSAAFVNGILDRIHEITASANTEITPDYILSKLDQKPTTD